MVAGAGPGAQQLGGEFEKAFKQRPNFFGQQFIHSRPPLWQAQPLQRPFRQQAHVGEVPVIRVDIVSSTSVSLLVVIALESSHSLDFFF